jgi:hypothetical protein
MGQLPDIAQCAASSGSELRDPGGKWLGVLSFIGRAFENISVRWAPLSKDRGWFEHDDAARRYRPSSPVVGLRPMRWPFLRTTKEPNDDSFSVAPRSRQSAISLSTKCNERCGPARALVARGHRGFNASGASLPGTKCATCDCPGDWHLSPQEKDLRCFRLFGTVFAILSFIVAATYVVSTANAREADVPFRSIVPSSWTLAPPAPQSHGRRFVSPSQAVMPC